MLQNMKLRIPVIAAPMFRVSGTKLVIEACKNRIIGSFPHINPRTSEELDKWLEEITETLKQYPDAAPYALNIIMRNKRLAEDFEVIKKYKPPIIITSVGSPEKAVPVIHEYGGIVFSDVATLEHARKAIEFGVDGLILLCAGAGGNSGWNNPFAFVRAVREFYNGPIILAGGIVDGAGIKAAEVLGADLSYIGTRFIATEESMAEKEYKERLVETDMDDVMTTTAFSGMPANYLRSTVIESGLDPNNLPTFEVFNYGEHRKKRWKNIWSAGHGVTNIREVLKVKELINKLEMEYKNY